MTDALDFPRPQRERPQVKIDPRLLAFGDEVKGSGRGHTVGKPDRGLQAHGVCRYINGRHACYDYGDYCPVVQPRIYVQQREQDIVFRPVRFSHG
jgi:hypothetical protein